MADRDQELKHPDQAEIVKKLEHFHQEFSRYFQTKLKVIVDQADGLIPTKEGVKLKILSWGTDWAKDAVSIVPVTGPFMNLVLKAIQQSIDKKNEKIQKHNAKNVSQQISSLSSDGIIFIIQDVALEVIRIYEYQIALLRNDDDIKKMAHAAVDCATSSFAHEGTESHPHIKGKIFERNWILKGIVEGAKHYKFEKLKLKTYIPNLTWQVPEVFTLPGIWCSAKSFYGIEPLDTAGTRAEDYGYRGQVMEWIDGEYRPFPGLDDNVPKKSSVHSDKMELYKFHQSYSKRVLHMIVGRGDINNYKEHLKNLGENETPQRFNQYVASQYDRTNDITLIAVYRSKALKNHNLSRGVFDNSNFSGIGFKCINLNNSSWKKAILINATMTDVDLSYSILKKTAMQRAIFKGKKMSLNSADIDYADFSFAHAEPDIDFKDVVNYKGAIFHYCNFDEIVKSGVDIKKMVEQAIKKRLAEIKPEELKLDDKKRSEPVTRGVTVQDNGKLHSKEIVTAFYLSSTAKALNKLNVQVLKAVTRVPKGALPSAPKSEEQSVVMEGGIIKNNAKAIASRVVTPFAIELDDESSEEDKQVSASSATIHQKKSRK